MATIASLPGDGIAGRHLGDGDTRLRCYGTVDLPRLFDSMKGYHR